MKHVPSFISENSFVVSFGFFVNPKTVHPNMIMLREVSDLQVIVWCKITCIEHLFHRPYTLFYGSLRGVLLSYILYYVHCKILFKDFLFENKPIIDTYTKSLSLCYKCLSSNEINSSTYIAHVYKICYRPALHSPGLMMLHNLWLINNVGRILSLLVLTLRTG